MAETWTIVKMELVGGAKRAKVSHRMPDGTARVREYGWPAAITREEILTTLDALHAQVVAEAPLPDGYDAALDLVGQPREA